MSESERVGTAGTEVRLAVSGTDFTVAAVGLTAGAIVLLSTLVGTLYHWGKFGTSGPVDAFAAGGALIAVLYLLPTSTRNQLSLEQSLGTPARLSRVLIGWIAAFALLAVIMVLTKSAAAFSRGWMIAFFTAGLVVLPLIDNATRRAASALIARGFVAARRVFLVGQPLLVRQRLGENSAEATTRIAGYREIDPGLDEASLTRLLGDAVQTARHLRIDDIVLVVPAEQQALIARLVEAFSALPVAIHLDVSALGRRFGDLSVHQIGTLSALSLDTAPLSPGQRFVKRALDILVSGLGLVIIAPLLAVIALLITWDSPGGVLYRQRRRGYNQREFTILKFRTMRAGGDPAFRQATHGDPRITSVGAWLRKTNLDELPQLVNVLRGDMSIVGPRPHAVDHDLQFEERIRLYPRRLNVRPGITGWAQINGFRGETDTDAKMAARVEHDLHYIDNWSLWLDLYIILATVVSPRSYRNAR